MKFVDVHLAVREALRGSPYSQFLITVQSLEQHPGRVEVEWRICISDANPLLYYRGREPGALLEMVREHVRGIARARAATDPPPPDALELVGTPPSQGDRLDPPVLVNVEAKS
jgi:hypothetical protein